VTHVRISLPVTNIFVYKHLTTNCCQRNADKQTQYKLECVQTSNKNAYFLSVKNHELLSGALNCLNF